MTLRNNDSQSLRLSRKHVQRFSASVVLVGAGTPSSLQLDQINMKCILKRGGREHVLFHESLQLLAIEAMFFTAIGVPLSFDMVELDATTHLLPIVLDLGSPINLFGEDELNLEVTTKSGWYGDYDATLSTIEIESREIIGVESVIPFIKTKGIQASQSRFVESLGDNITSVMLMNVEPSRTGANSLRVFDSIIIITDRYNVSDNRVRLIGRRATQFEDLAVANLRKENFYYKPETEIDNVQITLELNGSQVAATKNYIVYRTFLADAGTIRRSQATTNKHARRNQRKLEEVMA